MAFEREAPQTPAGIGRLTLRVATVLVDGVVQPAVGTFDFDVIDADGNVIRKRSGELLQHLTATQRTAVQNLLTNLRAKADAETIDLSGL